jgi:hypothetical protein
VDDEQERAPRLLLLDEAAVSHEADSAHRAVGMDDDQQS